MLKIFKILIIVIVVCSCESNENNSLGNTTSIPSETTNIDLFENETIELNTGFKNLEQFVTQIEENKKNINENTDPSVTEKFRLDKKKMNEEFLKLNKQKLIINREKELKWLTILNMILKEESTEIKFIKNDERIAKPANEKKLDTLFKEIIDNHKKIDSKLLNDSSLLLNPDKFKSDLNQQNIDKNYPNYALINFSKEIKDALESFKPKNGQEYNNNKDKIDANLAQQLIENIRKYEPATVKTDERYDDYVKALNNAYKQIHKWVYNV